MYDIIGDIHGRADELEALLLKLGYQRQGTVYKHPERKAIFVGDFIDGKGQHRKTVDICRSMVEQESALAVMGNHEFNAICYSIPDNTGDYLRHHNEKISGIMLSLLPSFPLVLIDTGRPLTGSKACRCLLGITG
ncbi:metallophosphoesterase [Endozoicomonas sp. SCSIO W0465]|uniref:metallophosphoesterase n=1 Tax=Endozoicomonas sp. SCSIO W0465 TaxID=2918516 RepID=UPI00207633A4|nr:metallophosphoesterase [Endozoicomonas sp. SCSIO W0465]USE35456.1 metallophosphoesterase [Endozoicomonas sp. SCSIO W0465]